MKGVHSESVCRGTRWCIRNPFVIRYGKLHGFASDFIRVAAMAVSYERDPLSHFLWPFKYGVQDLGTAQVDWLETSNAHVFKVNVPGMSKEDIKIQIEDDHILHVKGESIKEEEKTEGQWHCVERGKGGFSRRFSLPENVKIDQIKAQVENGVLTIIVPKDSNPKSRLRNINISSRL